MYRALILDNLYTCVLTFITSIKESTLFFYFIFCHYSTEINVIYLPKAWRSSGQLTYAWTPGCLFRAVLLVRSLSKRIYCMEFISYDICSFMLSLKVPCIIWAWSVVTYSEQIYQNTSQVVARKQEGLKQWNHKPPKQKLVAVAYERFQLKGFAWVLDRWSFNMLWHPRSESKTKWLLLKSAH